MLLRLGMSVVLLSLQFSRIFFTVGTLKTWLVTTPGGIISTLVRRVKAEGSECPEPETMFHALLPLVGRSKTSGKLIGCF